MPVMIASNAAASAQASAREKALEPFVAAGAFGPGEAIDWSPGDDADAQLVKAGVIKELRPGRYWHDRTAQEAGSGPAARKILVLVTGLLVLAGLVLIVSL